MTELEVEILEVTHVSAYSWFDEQKIQNPEEQLKKLECHNRDLELKIASLQEELLAQRAKTAELRHIYVDALLDNHAMKTEIKTEKFKAEKFKQLYREENAKNIEAENAKMLADDKSKERVPRYISMPRKNKRGQFVW